jgi:hypothetical protein
MKNDEIESKMEAYYNRSKFKSLEKLYQGQKDTYGWTRAQIKNFLQHREASQIFKTKKQLSIPISGLPGTYQADLMFFEKYARKNKGYKGVLTIININTRKGYAYPFKTKQKSEMIDLFERWRKSLAEKPFKVEVDFGSEFTSNLIELYFAHHDIILAFNDAGDKHAQGMVERFNKTLRNMLEVYMVKNDTTIWIDALDETVDDYNNSKHSAIGTTPNSITPAQETEFSLYGMERTHDALEQKEFTDFEPGMQVRIRRPRKKFSKELETFSRDIYTLDELDKYKWYVLNGQGIRLKTRYHVNDLLLVPKVHGRLGESYHKEKTSAERSAKSKRILRNLL